jgi:hypothetical protein
MAEFSDLYPMDKPDRFASLRLLDALRAAVKCEQTPGGVLSFVVGYVCSYDPDVDEKCCDVLREYDAARAAAGNPNV